MKKLLFAVVAVVAMSFASCGNKTAAPAETVDTDTVVTDTVVTDSAVVDSTVAE